MRRTVVAANWKMNMTPSQAEEFINAIKTDIPISNINIKTILISFFLFFPFLVNIYIIPNKKNNTSPTAAVINFPNL